MVEDTSIFILDEWKPMQAWLLVYFKEDLGLVIDLVEAWMNVLNLKWPYLWTLLVHDNAQRKKKNFCLT